MNTVLFPPPEPKLMHAPVSRPLITTWEASGRGCAGPPPGENAECNEASTSGAAKAQETASARTSAARNRADEPRRRRVRAVTLAAFAIGGVILVGRTPPPIQEELRQSRRLLDPVVLSRRHFLAGGRVEVEDGQDDHERLLLPDRDVVSLVADRRVEHDRVGRKACLGALDHRLPAAAQLGGADIEELPARVTLGRARVVFELDHEVDDQLVRGRADVRACHPLRLEEDRSAARQQLVDGRLDPLANLLAQLEDQTCVLRRLSAVMRNLDRLAKRDEPLRW